MTIVYVILGLNVMYLFLYSRNLLMKKKTFTLIFIFNSILFFIATIFANSNLEITKNISFLKVPIFSQIIFLLLLSGFRYLFNKTPIDTFWTMESNLIKDSIFNFLFWFLGSVIPIILVAKNLI